MLLAPLPAAFAQANPAAMVSLGVAEFWASVQSLLLLLPVFLTYHVVELVVDVGVGVGEGVMYFVK